MKKSILTFLLLTLIFLSGNLILTASPISLDKNADLYYFADPNEEEPEPWD